MNQNKSSITLTPDAARRLSRVVKDSERTPKGPAVKRRRPPVLTAPNWYAITTGTITAGDQAAKKLGKGPAKIQLVKFDASDNGTYDDYPDLSEVTVYNGGPEIAADRLIQIKVICGRYSVDVDYCVTDPAYG